MISRDIFFLALTNYRQKQRKSRPGVKKIVVWYFSFKDIIIITSCALLLVLTDFTLILDSKNQVSILFYHYCKCLAKTPCESFMSITVRFCRFYQVWELKLLLPIANTMITHQFHKSYQTLLIDSQEHDLEDV